MYTTGAALTFVESARGSGLDAWRRLYSEYDPMSTQKAFSSMGVLMKPTRAKADKDISVSIELWEKEYR